MRWPHILFNEDGTGLIQIVVCKSKAARRILPMTPRIYAGHINGDSVKDQQKRVLLASGVEPFEFVPYTLRHTGLTNLGRRRR